MATESPVRFVGSGTRRWAPDKQPNIFISTSSSNANDYQGIELLMKDQNLNGNRKESLPNRCGSAPPSMEGSFQAIHNVLGPKNISIPDSIESIESEEQLRADPSYLTYYLSNVNLNPRLPPPLFSRENRLLARRVIQPSDSAGGSAFLSRASLSTHEEEPEDDRSPMQSSLEARHKSLVDLIQEDFPRTPSPIYNTRPPLSNQVLTEESIESNKVGLPQSSPSSERIMSSRSSALKGELSNNDAHFNNEVLVSDIVSASISDVESEMKNLGLSNERRSQPPTHRSLPNTSHSRVSHSQPKPPPLEVPLHQTPSFSPALYGPTTYINSGNPFLPNMQSSNMFTPQYNISGYALNPSVAAPPFITGYPHHSQSGIDLQQLYKFYGQAFQPSFSDPLYMHYVQQSQFDPSAGTQLDRFNEPKGAAINIPSPRIGGATSPNYYGSPQGLGFMMLYGTSPIGSPVVPESPAAMPKRNEMRMPISSSKSFGSYSGWQGQRGREKVDDSKPYSFLEELKSSKARRFELSDIYGHIIEFSADQHGSRFIQQKLENCSPEEKDAVFEEVLPQASTLMTDVFGNYVIQKFFEHGNSEQRRQLANKLAGHILPLSLQMYGCRVIQKALEVIEIDQKIQLVHELDGHVMRCVRDQNGNHVIQKCIECVPSEQIEFIISAFHDNVFTLSTHPYGCRVIQRVLEHCSDEAQSERIVNEIMQYVCNLAQDQYGNYVTQHVLERGKPRERSHIIKKLAGQIVQMSQNKYASNVIEKCLVYGDDSDKDILIKEIVGQSEGNDNLLMMMKDQFANYVVQKIIETCTEKQREKLLQQIKVHLPALKKYTYGKHIVARVEQLCGEEGGSEES